MAQSDSVTREVGEDRYKFLYLDPLVAADLSWEVLHIISPALGAFGGEALTQKGNAIENLLDGMEEVEGGTNGYAMAFERSILGLFQRCTKQTQRDLIQTMKEVSFLIVNNKELPMTSQFSIHFRGRPAAMYKWLGVSLSVQLKDFFSSLGTGTNLVARVRDLAQSLSQNTSSETPSSGE